MIAPSTVYAGPVENEEYSVATAWHILQELFKNGHFSEPLDLDRLAVTQAGIRELPLPVRQAWGDSLVEAASLFRRKFLL